MSRKGTYFLAFILSLLISNGVAYFLLTDSMENFSKEFLAMFEEDEIEQAAKIDSTFVVEKKIPEPVLQYSKYLHLNKMLDSFLSKDLTKFPRKQVDSLNYYFQSYVDTLSQNHQKFIKEINELNRLNISMQDSLKTITQEKEELENRIATLQNQEAEQEEIQQAETSAAGIKYLATTYNTMNDQSVADLLAQMQKEKAAKILMQMNKRKAGKVLAAMNKRQAGEITKLILE